MKSLKLKKERLSTSKFLGRNDYTITIKQLIDIVEYFNVSSYKQN